MTKYINLVVLGSIMAVKITNLVKFHTLLLLAEKPKHGYDIIKELEQNMERKISAGQIYPFLKELKGNNYIDFKEEEEREKKVYYLTTEGKKFVKGMFSRFGDLIHHAISNELTKCSHCSCEIYKGGVKHKINNKQLDFCCMSCANSYKKSGCC